MTVRSTLSREETFEALMASLAECDRHAGNLELNFLRSLLSIAVLEVALKWDKIDEESLGVEDLLRLKLRLQSKADANIHQIFRDR